MATWNNRDASQPYTAPTSLQHGESRRKREPIVAFLSMRLHEDGGFTTVMSDHVKPYADTVDIQQLKHMMLQAQQTSALRHEPAQQQSHSLDPFGADSSHSTMMPTMSFDSWTEETETEKPAKILVTRSFMIQETAKVEKFLISRLGLMQQTAVKRLAKAWIKGICPKKQALFPYHAGDENMPSWWPRTGCPFREPDHIKKEERLALCLHLLRLRPEEGKLQEMNGGNPDMPHSSHNLCEWTKFLQLAAPVEAINDLRDGEELAKHRVRYLNDLYKVAQMEEDWSKDAIDGTDTFTWTEEESPAKLQPRKRGPPPSKQEVDVTPRQSKKRPAITLKQELAATPRPSKRRATVMKQEIITPQPPKQRQSHASARESKSKLESDGERNATKLTRRMQTQSTKPEAESTQHEPTVTTRWPTNPLAMDCTPMTLYTDDATLDQPSSYHDMWHHATGPAHSHTTDDTILTSSFSSTATSYGPSSTTDTYMADAHHLMPVTMDASSTGHSLDYNGGGQQLMLQTHMASHIPQPQFDTVPNTPVAPHASLINLSSDHNTAIAQPHPWTMQDLTTLNYNFSGDPYDNSACGMPDTLSAAMMMRPGSESLYYANMRHRGSQSSVVPSPIVRASSQGSLLQRSTQASYGYDTISRPI